MPVPVSVTHGGGGGLQAATHLEVVSEGPFARLAAQRAAGIVPPAAEKTGQYVQEVPNAHIMASDKVEGLDYSIEINDLTFCYPDISGQPQMHIKPVIENMDAKLPPGSCCLLIGANGAGKTTLLKVLGGKHMVGLWASPGRCLVGLPPHAPRSGF